MCSQIEYKSESECIEPVIVVVSGVSARLLCAHFSTAAAAAAAVTVIVTVIVCRVCALRIVALFLVHSAACRMAVVVAVIVVVSGVGARLLHACRGSDVAGGLAMMVVAVAMAVIVVVSGVCALGIVTLVLAAAVTVIVGRVSTGLRMCCCFC